MREFFASPKINTAAVNKFFNESKSKNNHIHAMSIYIGGEKMLEFAAKPYSLYHKREVYSLSKSFTACAIGAAEAEGLLNSNEKIVDIFPDKLPDTVSDNLKKMTIWHLLTMTTGHSGCVMNAIHDKTDPAKAFLACEVEHEPGTWFVYNTGASMMLAAVLERKTGRKLFDYISEKIFNPLGINGTYWTQCVSGINEGGIGLHVSCDDISRFGNMLLAGGIYNGKRILPEKWIDTAGSALVDNKNNGDSGTGVWTIGYGFQFWRTPEAGFRGDGLKGQLCMVMPEFNAVFNIVACTFDMEAAICDAVTLAKNMLENGNEEYNLPDYEPLAQGNEPIPDFFEKPVLLSPNTLKLTSLKLKKSEDGIEVELYNGFCRQTLSAGNGIWLQSELYMPAAVPKIIGFMDPYAPEKFLVASSYKISDGKLVICAKHLSDPHTVYITVSENRNCLSADIEVELFSDMLPEDARRLEGKIIE